MQRLRIVLPLPSPHLSPNARVHWGVKSRAVKAYRSLAAWHASQLWTEQQPPMAEADIVATFRFRDRRRRDRDNLLAMLKAAFDGLADAGIVEDDSSFRHEVRIDEPTDDPHVAIEVMERMPA